MPIVHDVLILGKNAAHGTHGFRKALELLAPGIFQVVEIAPPDDHIAAVFINKKLTRKLSTERIMRVLQQHVFGYISDTELIQVDLSVRFATHNLNG